MLKGRKEIFSEGLDAYMDYRRPESIQNWILGILGRSWREKRSKGEWLTSVNCGGRPSRNGSSPSFVLTGGVGGYNGHC